jgi:hypothetical protein
MKLNRITASLAIACAVIVGGYGSNATAATIALWTFETSVPVTAGPLAPETGAGAATGVHASGSVVYSNPAGNGSNESFSSNFWNTGDYYQFTASSAGLSNIAISWDETRSSTGPDTFKVQYTTDGSTYTDLPPLLVPAYTVPVTTWSATTADATGASSFSRDLSSITALNSNATIGFRLVDTAATSATAGTGRVDNFKITSVDVPEPASCVLLCLTGVAAIGFGRRR